MPEESPQKTEYTILYTKQLFQDELTAHTLGHFAQTHLGIPHHLVAEQVKAVLNEIQRRLGPEEEAEE